MSTLDRYELAMYMSSRMLHCIRKTPSSLPHLWILVLMNETSKSRYNLEGASNEYSQHIFLFILSEYYAQVFLGREKQELSKAITKTYQYNLDPLKPHVYVIKLGFTGVYIIFLNFAKNIDCGYSLEPPYRGDSNEYPQSMFWAEVWKISEFLFENFQFLVKVSIYLNRRVFVIE